MESNEQIFLCYASEDREKVGKVYDKLKEAGFHPWMDKKDILIGQDWDREIRRAIRESKFIITFFSSNSVSKEGYIQKELKLALERVEEIPEGWPFILPVRLDICTIPISFQHLQYCDLFVAGEFDRLLLSIEIHLSILPDSDRLKEVLANPNQIIISYSHKDIKWLELLKAVLNSINLRYRLIIWDDQKFRPGDKWQEEIDKALAAAKLAILLVSPDFLRSDFIVDYELPYLLQASKIRGLKIFWIQLSYITYEETSLNISQALGDPKMPLGSLPESEAKNLLMDMGELIKSALELD